MITSLHNKRVAKAVRLKKRALREKDRRFLVEGTQALREAVQSGAVVQEIFHGPAPEARVEAVLAKARHAGIPVREVSDEVIGRLTSTVTPQGIVGVADFVDVSLDAIPEDSGLIPVLIEVRDPGNAGTILRSADAAGADAVVFARSSVDIYNPKAVRATAGSLFHLPLVRGTELPDTVALLRGRGLTVLAADPRGQASIYETDLTRPTAVLFGNEARGLPPEALELAEHSVRVPIAGRAESLNLAASTALVMFEAARQRAGGPSLASIVAGSAHDIRSPLAALLGFTSTMLSRWERLADDQKLVMVQGIAQDAARMRLLIAQLVDAARLASGTLSLRLAPVDLLELASEAQRSAGDMEIEVKISGGPERTVADPDRVRTILSALIEGAQWFGEDGPVRIEVAASSITVSRSGTSLDADDARALFAPRRAGTGHGSKVGLFVARGLVEAHGGALEASASQGIRFTLRLPDGPHPTQAEA